MFEVMLLDYCSLDVSTADEPDFLHCEPVLHCKMKYSCLWKYKRSLLAATGDGWELGLWVVSHRSSDDVWWGEGS